MHERHRRFARLVCTWAIVAGSVTACQGQPQPGQIVVDSGHPAWFKYQDGGPFYLCGPGDPEGFLYRGTRNADGTRTGDQASLISKLVGTGANSIYMQVIRSNGGDGDSTHNPFVSSNVNGSLDVDILNQWETWFTAMDDNGIALFLILYDDSAQPYGYGLVAGQLTSQEAYFIDGIVSRFKHHKRLIWCVAEEYGEALSDTHASKIAERIKWQDNNKHPVAIHQNSGTSFDFNGNSAFNQFAVQWNMATSGELHAGTVAAWNNVGGLVNVNMAEFANAGTGEVLREKVWAIAMGGGYSMILGMDIASTPVSDLQICGRLVGFMEATRFNEAAPHDELAGSDTDYVLASPGEVYIAYGNGGDGFFGLSMLPGNYAVKWYDPGTGSWVDQAARAVSAAGSQLFAKPSVFAEDAALYVVRTVPALAGNPFPLSGALGVHPDVQLSWTAGVGATSHNVYFGAAAPGDFRGNQTETTFDPGPLDSHTTYYWRIDEVNQNGTNTGSVWSFTTDGVPGDMNGDGDVDQEDFGLFQACFTVPGDPIGPQCLFADLNTDGLVDQLDSVMFDQCLSGPMIPADPDCAN